MPYLGVLKRHRPYPFLMTHAVDGYSLALDFKVTKRNRLDNWFLLLLRCLVLALLAAAFARPYLRTEIPLPQTTAPARKVVLLVDVSASMKRDPLWKEAKAAVEAELKKATPKDQFSLAVFD